MPASGDTVLNLLRQGFSAVDIQALAFPKVTASHIQAAMNAGIAAFRAEQEAAQAAIAGAFDAPITGAGTESVTPKSILPYIGIIAAGGVILYFLTRK